MDNPPNRGGAARTDVGGTAFDVNGDGWVDQVSGRDWYRNLKSPREESFRRYDIGAIPTHDNITADVDGDGSLELVSLMDSEGLFWYDIPEDGTGRWPQHEVVGVTDPQCYGGVSAGDLDGDGDIDLARVDRWLENADGKGREWRTHHAFDFGQDGQEGPWGIITRAETVDLDDDGDLDLLQAEGDFRDGRIAWFENRDAGGSWTRHLIKEPGHQQDFHSLCISDFDEDGDLDVFSGGGPLTKGKKRFFIWENSGGKERVGKEHVIAIGHATHESVSGDVDGDGDIDIATKPWDGDRDIFLENQVVE